MSEVLKTSRRGFLALLMRLSPAGALQFFLWRGAMANGEPAERLCERLSQLYDCRKSARVIGEEYLRIATDEAHKMVLLNFICRGSVSDQERLLLADSSTMRNMLKKWVRKDFELGRTVLVRGWMLSRTEVRLCALTALSA